MTQMTQRTELRPVDRGVALLDQRWPDWWKNVELSDLNLSDPENCVLGMAFPECTYNDTVQDLSGLKLPDVPMISENFLGTNPEWIKYIEDLTAWELEHGFVADPNAAKANTEGLWRSLIRFRQMHPGGKGYLW